jgi:hypothetical protein
MIQIAIPKKHLQLKGCKGSHRGGAGSPQPTQPTGREALVAQPEPLTVVGKDAQRRASPVAEDKERSREGIGSKLLATQPAEPVDSLSKIHGLHGYENTHMRSDLDHRPVPKKAFTRSTTHASMGPVQ